MEFEATRYSYFVVHDKPLCKENTSYNGNPVISFIWRSVEIEKRSHTEDIWAIVVDGVCVLNRNLECEPELLPSGRDSEFLSRTRFSFVVAKDLASRFISSHKEFHAKPTTS